MSLSHSSSQNAGNPPLRVVSPYLHGSSFQQDASLKESIPLNKSSQLGNSGYHSNKQLFYFLQNEKDKYIFNLDFQNNNNNNNNDNNNMNKREQNVKVSVQFHENDQSVHSNNVDQSKQTRGRSSLRDNSQNRYKQKSQKECDEGSKQQNGSNLNIKQSENKFDDKSNVEYKRMLDILSEENGNKQKKINQLKNCFQSESIIFYDKEKEQLPDGMKLKSLRGIVNAGGEKNEDIIAKTIQIKKGELEVMENQIQEQSMYNQTLNFMQLRTDNTLKEQKKLVLKMEKLNKIVSKRETEYNAILLEHNSQQKLTEFKMAEQVASILNKEEIYKSIDQNRIKQKKIQNEDFHKLASEQEEIIKQISILKKKVQEQEKLIVELNQVASNVGKLKMSFPYTFQNAESMLYIVDVLCHPQIESVLGDIFYIKADNKSLIMDSIRPKNTIITSTSSSPNKKQLQYTFSKSSQNLFHKTSDDKEKEKDKNMTRYDYRHQVSNSFHQTSAIMKQNKIYIKILEAFSQKDKIVVEQKSRSLLNTSIKLDKNKGKKSRLSIFVRKKSISAQSHDNLAGQQYIDVKKLTTPVRNIIASVVQILSTRNMSSHILGLKKHTLIQIAKELFLNSIKRYNPHTPDFKYRFILRDLTSLDSKSNRYMSTLEQRIQEFENIQKMKIDDYITNVFHEMMNQFIQFRSLVSLKIQEKNIKFEKNKKLKRKINELKKQILKQYEIKEEAAAANSNCYIAEMQNEHNINENDEDDQQYDQDDFEDSPEKLDNQNKQNSCQSQSQREQRNIRLQNVSQNHLQSKTNTPKTNSKENKSNSDTFDEVQEQQQHKHKEKEKEEDKNKNKIERHKERGDKEKDNDNDDDDEEEVNESQDDIKTIYKDFSTEFKSINLLNTKLDTLKYQNLHVFTDNGKSNSQNLPFESSYVILEKTLSVVKRILQLTNTCLTATYEHYYDNIDTFKDLGKAYSLFKTFNNKMQEFLKLQEGRFFGSFKYNQSLQVSSKQYSRGINSIIRQFKQIFNGNLMNAQKLFQSLIAHDVVVINFLDMDDVESTLKKIKQRFDQMCAQFITKYRQAKGQDLISRMNISQNENNGDGNQHSLVELLQIEKKEEEDKKLRRMAEKSLELQLMGMISEQIVYIIEKAHNACQETTKYLFDMCVELYLIIFQMLIYRKQTISISRTSYKDVYNSPNQISSGNKSEQMALNSPLLLFKPMEDHKKKNQQNMAKLSNTEKEGRKLSLNTNKSERKSFMRTAAEQDSPVKKSIISIFSRAVKDRKSKKVIQTPPKQKEDKFSIINEEGGNKVHGSSSNIIKDSDEKSEDTDANQRKISLVLLPPLQNDKMLFDMMGIPGAESLVDLSDTTDIYYNKVQPDKLDELEERSINEKKKRVIPYQQNDLVSLKKQNNIEQSLHRSNSSSSSYQQSNSSQHQSNTNNNDNQENSNDNQENNKRQLESPFRQSAYKQNGSQNPFSLYKTTMGAVRSEEESRILISSLAYYKNKEKTINKVIYKKQQESGEFYDSFHNSLLTVDLKVKQNGADMKNKQLVGYISNQVQELQHDSNDINLIKEAQFFEDERKYIKQTIQDEMKYYLLHSPPPPQPPPPPPHSPNDLKRSFYLNNSSFLRTNNSMNSSVIGPNTFTSSLKQLSNSPSSLPSILKNISPVNQSQSDLKVKVVKFPTVANNKKGVIFKDSSKNQKSISDIQNLNKGDPQLGYIPSNSIKRQSIGQSNFSRKSQSPNNLESKRNNLVKLFVNNNHRSEQSSLNQSMAQQSGLSSRGRQRDCSERTTYFDPIQNEREKIYEQYSPERFKEEEVVLDEYKKVFLHLNQVYKATIQASKDKLVQNKSSQSELSNFESQLNQENLRRYQGQDKGQMLFKLFKKKLQIRSDSNSNNVAKRTQTDESSKQENSSFFRTIDEIQEDRRNKSKLTKILPFADKLIPQPQKQITKQRQSMKKQNVQNNSKKLSRASISNDVRVQSKKKNIKKKQQQSEGRKEHNLPSLKSRNKQEKQQDENDDNDIDIDNDSKDDQYIYNDVLTQQLYQQS